MLVALQHSISLHLCRSAAICIWMRINRFRSAAGDDFTIPGTNSIIRRSEPAAHRRHAWSMNHTSTQVYFIDGVMMGTTCVWGFNELRRRVVVCTKKKNRSQIICIVLCLSRLLLIGLCCWVNRLLWTLNSLSLCLRIFATRTLWLLLP